MKWRQLEDFPDYEVNTNGEVWSKKFGKRKKLKDNINLVGYCYVILSGAKGKRIFQIHRLIALSFIQNPKNKPQVNHK